MTDAETFPDLGRTIESAYELVRRLLVGAAAVAGVVAWTGFWLLLARIHARQGDWSAVAVTAVLGFGPLAAAVARVAPVAAVGPVRDAVRS